MALIDILEEIDRLQVEAAAMRPIDPARMKKLQLKLRLDWNYHSNAIEGNTLTLSETRMLLLQGYHVGNKLGRHYEEIELHNHVLETLEELVRKNEPFTEVLIRNLHAELMGADYFVTAFDELGNKQNIKGLPGQYKERINGVNRIVGDKEIFVPFASPDEVRMEMPELVQWYRDEEEKKELHPVVIAATFHYRFVTLHPFDDGNGRMARILMNLILMRAGYVPAIIQMKDRDKYIFALAMAQTGGELTNFVELVAEETLRSLELLLKAAKGESIEDKDDVDKELALLKKELLNKEAGIKVTQSYNTVFEIVFKQILPFFYEIKDGLEGFEEFFFQNSYFVEIRTPKSIDRRDLTNESIEQDLKDAIEEGHHLFYIQFNINFNGFKHNIENPGGVTIIIKISFEEYKYIIISTDEEMKIESQAPRSIYNLIVGAKEYRFLHSKITKLYDQPLTDEEKQTIIHELKKEALQKVKELSGKNLDNE